MTIIYLIGSIIFGVIGFLAIISATRPNAPWWMSWVSWFSFTPSFIFLFNIFEVFGVAGAFALWGAGTAVIVSIQGVRWGDKLSGLQIGSMALILLGLTLFGLSVG